METQSLWPDFTTVEITKSPKTILQEQVGYLMSQTKNVLSGEVKTYHKADVAGSQLYYSFVILAPALNNYRFHLLNLTHFPTSYYPAVIDSFDANTITVNSEDELIAGIKHVFNKQETVRVISLLLSQSLAE